MRCEGSEREREREREGGRERERYDHKKSDDNTCPGCGFLITVTARWVMNIFLHLMKAREFGFTTPYHAWVHVSVHCVGVHCE